MRHPLRLTVSDPRVAAAWYARALDGEVLSVDDRGAELRLGSEGLRLLLQQGAPAARSSTPVLELRVAKLAEWVDAALVAGATRETPIDLPGYAQVRDPSGYLWALRGT